MRISDDDLRAIWQNGSTDAQSERSGCLTDHEWARLLSQEADGPERVRMANHIAACDACTEEYRLLLPVKAWNAEAERILAPADAHGPERHAGWRTWWSSPRLAFAVGVAAMLIVSNGVVWSQLARSKRESTSLQTQLARNNSELSAARDRVMTLEEQLRSAGPTHEQLNALQQQVAQLSTPGLDAAIVDLDPQLSAAVRGSSDAQVVMRAAGAPSVTLILNFPPLASRSTLEVAIESRTGQVVWTARAQRDAGTAALTVTLPAGYPADRYVLRLRDVTRRPMPLATYSVSIQDANEKGR